ncbi:MAG: hypothetical protein WD847_10015 [Pirellulales bacterium]
MPIVVVCPSCGHQLRAGNELAGRAALCPACRSVLSVPSQPGAWDPFATPASPTTPNRLDVPPASGPQARHPVWLLPVVLGGSCVFLLAAALLTSSLRKAGHVAAARADQPGAAKRDPLRPDLRRPQPAGAAAGQPAAPPGSAGRVAPARDPAPIVWKVEVDPPASPILIEPQAAIRLVAPGKVGLGAVLYPDVPSSIIALGNITEIGGGMWEIWDLSSMTRSARLKGRLPSKMAAISPDGAYVAAATGFPENKVLIWDVKSNEPLGEVEVGPFPEILAFPSPIRLVTGGDVVTLWRLPDGEVERDIKLPRLRDREALAFSPGGRYLAVASEKTVWVYDLDSGGLVGQLPGADGKAAGIAFSPDGLELAALFERFDNEKVICWDVESGRVVAEVDLGSEVTSRTPSGDYRGRALEWFPDRKRWLAYGRFVIDRRIGKTVWSLPSDAVPAGPRVVIDDERLMLASGSNMGALTAYNLPQQQIAAASTVIESGGQLADIGMPPLTVADWTSVVKVPLNAAVVWRAAPDPLASSGQRLLARPVPIRAEGGSVEAVMVARADLAQALVMVASRPAAHDRKHAEGNRAAGMPVRLDRYDLRTGRRRGALELPHHAELVSLSPDGAQALVRTADETNRFNVFSQQDDRLDVYRLDDSAHLCGWRPYRNQPGSGPTGESWHEMKDQKVTEALFVGSSHVLTLNEPKTLVLWKLPECRAVYMMQGAELPSLSPNHKHLAVYAHNGYRFFDSLTGEPVGNLPLGNLPLGSRAAAAAFHPAGRRFAVVSPFNAGARISCWDIDQGQLERAFLVPQQARQVEWCGDSHLLLDNAWLVDIALGAVMWKYELAQGRHLRQRPDGRHWFVSGPPPGGGPSFLRAATVPGAAELAAVADARLCVAPGSTLRLSLKLQTPPGRPGFTEEVRQRIVDQLAESGIQVVTGQAPVVLELSMMQVHTGETREYVISRSVAGIRGKTVTVPLQQVECRIVVLHDGKPVWEGGTTCTNEVWRAKLEQGESPEARLAKEMWDAAARYFLDLVPPTRVFAGGSADGLGSSDLAAALP